MDKLDELTVPQLKARLRERGASMKGTKAALIKRLQEFLDNEKDDLHVSSGDRDDQPNETRCPTTQDEDASSLADAAFNNSHAGRAESVVSCRSSVSNVSMKSLRAIEATKKAALLARASFLEEKRKIELEELNLRLRKEELMISTELAEVEARERVLVEAGETQDTTTAVEQVPRLSERPNMLSSHSLSPRSGESEAALPGRRPENSSEAPQQQVRHSARTSEDGPAIAAVETRPRSELHQSQQADYSQLLLTQLQKGQLPKLDIPIFEGDVTKYRCFIRAFDSRINTKTDDPDERLYYLQTYLRGKPLDIVRGCLHISDGSGYLEARRLLERRYGDPDSVSSAFVDVLTEWGPIKPGDVDSLDKFSIALTSCLNVMQDIPPGSRETDHPRIMRKIVEKLPYHCQDNWRSRVIQIKEEAKRKVTFEDIVTFVDREVRKITDPTFGKFTKPDKQMKKPHTVSATGVGKSVPPRVVKCLYCEKAHHTDSCERLNRLPYEGRRGFIIERKLCFGCLRQKHQYSACTRKLTCKVCRGRHPTPLHRDNPSAPSEASTTSSHSNGDSGSPAAVVRNGRLSADSTAASAGTRDSSSTMMAVTPVVVRSPDGSRSVITYAFLDLGSSATFCTDLLLRNLNIRGKTTNLKMMTATSENQSVQCQVVEGLSISGLHSTSRILLPPTYTLERIPVKREDIATPADVRKWPHLEGISVPQIDAEIGLMIGGNCPEALCPLEVRRGGEGEPFAFRSELGWIVYGPRRQDFDRDHFVRVNRVGAREADLDLHEKFISLYNKEFGDNTSSADIAMSVEDRKWLKTVEEGTRYIDGHYEVPLPLKNDAPFPNNKQQALFRVEHLKRKMIRSEKYMEDYKNFVNDLIKKNYAEMVQDDQSDISGRVWYIPHHGVYHPAKPDKIRVVYDCSAKFRSVSLNDRLTQGPNLTSSLLGVLMRFRERPFAVMADIEKMFYQVRVPPRQRSLLRFLWWPGGDIRRDVREYQVNVHLFGAISSPSCANFALRKSARDFGDDFPSDVKRSITRSFYVDDYLRSFSTAEELCEVTRGVRDCCAKGGFRLTGFVSNNLNILKELPETDCAFRDVVDLTRDDLSAHRALGVQWNVRSDTLSFRIDIRKGPATRRGILGTVSAVYDPLGFGAPFLLPAKVLLQDLCRMKLGWDDQIPDIYSKTWDRWCQQLEQLRTFSVPRSLTPDVPVHDSQLHLFADASESGYGAVAYYRTTTDNGSVSTSLLMSKSRVAPLKTCSIPRLELAAATLAVQLSTQICQELELPIRKVFFWTDSMSNMRYINNETSRFQTFVANRLTIIHDGSKPHQWRYVPSALNIADVLSRGISARELYESDWTTGPPFLKQPESEWPDQPDLGSSSEGEPLEVKKRHVNVVVADEDHTTRFVNSVSDWHKLKIRVAWILRLKDILRDRVAKKGGSLASASAHGHNRLTAEELMEAEMAIIKHVQKSSFPHELSSAPVKKSSALYKLHPYKMDGALRVGGRLENAQLSESSKHQIILPKKGHVTDAIIREVHERSGHSGREYVLAVLRCKYWIVDGNAAVRRVLSKCVRCRKLQAPAVRQIMANLPPERTASSKSPFSQVGTDFFGPFYVKVGRKQFKRFAVLFSCLSSRAVHIEVCDSLDTSSFINALRRFQARRGQATYIRSDNGTNFVAAEKELREELRKLQEKGVHEFLLKEGVTWVFNPPGASSHGGVWERQIRSIRKVLNALLREQTLTDESLRTLLCEVESILNSTPITTVSSDPTDLQPLTPNDLLLLRGGPTPDGLFTERDSRSVRRWRQMQYLADVFWRRWVREYLPLLQMRHKWNKVERNLAVNDVVLIVDMNSPRCKWPLGRVKEIFPDRKGFVRSAMIQTATSVLKRPISKLVLVLETER